MAEQKTPGIFNKLLSAGETALDRYIAKARSDIASEDDDAFYGKSVSRDLSYSSGSQGFHEKSSQLSFAFLAQMARKNTIVAAIIQTLQNKVAAHAVVARDKHSKGFRIKLKNEEAALQEIMEEMFGEENENADAGNAEGKSGQNQDIATQQGKKEAPKEEPVEKADFEFADTEPAEGDDSEEGGDDEVEQALSEIDSQMKEDSEKLPGDTNEDGEMSDKEKRRLAKEELRKRTKAKIEALQELILTCGSLEDRPFESRKWNMDSYLRAIVRDRLTYDQIATEIVPDQSDKIHHWKPVDGGTMRYASGALAKYKDFDANTAGYDLLYPEKELEALKEQRDALELDEEKLAEDDYKFVQVIRGRIVRAFTPDEMAIGMANPTTDIYMNGYSISELEILVGMVSAHIFTENYNRSYFTQGFSAKGILHIKSPLNRRKLETLRMQWNHMIKGNRNSFQTPIMSGMDDVKWIPLTQSHSDMEFNNWMNYLIKIICAVYQIDPFEIGFGMKDEGGSGGGGLSGDNTKEKAEASKSKGFVPLLRFVQNYLNTNIVNRIDPDYELEFVGVDDESKKMSLDRQKEEVKFKKSVNEIREEDDLPPIAGADDLILDPTFMQWFTQFHPDGKKLAEGQQADAGVQGIQDQAGADAQGDQDQMGNQVDQDAMAAQGSQDAQDQEKAQDVQGGLEGVQGQIDTDNTNKDAVKQAKAMPKKPMKKSFRPKERKIAVEFYRIKGE